MQQRPIVGAGHKPPPKAEQDVDHRADLLNQMAHSKLNCPTSLGEELTKQLQLKQLLAGKNNSSDHSA
jgi:hypothetical protein